MCHKGASLGLAVPSVMHSQCASQVCMCQSALLLGYWLHPTPHLRQANAVVLSPCQRSKEEQAGVRSSQAGQQHCLLQSCALWQALAPPDACTCRQARGAPPIRAGRAANTAAMLCDVLPRRQRLTASQRRAQREHAMQRLGQAGQLRRSSLGCASWVGEAVTPGIGPDESMPSSGWARLVSCAICWRPQALPPQGR